MNISNKKEKSKIKESFHIQLSLSISISFQYARMAFDHGPHKFILFYSFTFKTIQIMGKK